MPAISTPPGTLPPMATLTQARPEISPDDLRFGESVTSGTLRLDHLADALLGEVDRVGLSHHIPADLAKRAQTLAASAADPVADPLPKDAADLVAEITDWLNDHAPDGWCLQPSEGDPADLAWHPVSLRAQLQAVGSQWVGSDWTDPQNESINDIIERFNDDPESLQNFEQSDWVNLAECYTSDLLKRWNQQESDLKALFDDLCQQLGYASALEAMEGDTIDDPDDFTAAYVNHAMTWGARQLMHEIESINGWG